MITASGTNDKPFSSLSYLSVQTHRNGPPYGGPFLCCAEKIFFVGCMQMYTKAPCFTIGKRGSAAPPQEG